MTTVTAPFDDSQAGDKPSDYVETGYCDVKAAIKRAVGIGQRSTHEALNVEVPMHGERHEPLQRLIAAVSSLVSYPDDYVGWLPFVARTIATLQKGLHWDVMLTSAPPMTTNIAAALSHGRVPWVADLRDLWAEDDSSERSLLQRLFDDRVERASLMPAVSLIASSELSAKRFRNRYPGKACHAIYTGFDKDEWEPVAFGREGYCTLLYAGSLYRGKRDPTVLFTALREILDERLARDEELRVTMFSRPEPWLLHLIARFRLERVVHVHDLIERRRVLEAERRADRLITFSWDGPTAEGVVAGKLFEYLGARRPILAIGGPPVSAVEDLLRETGTGVRCRTVRETKSEILRALLEHRSGTLRIIPADSARHYGAEACARKFAEVLDEAAYASKSDFCVSAHGC